MKIIRLFYFLQEIQNNFLETGTSHSQYLLLENVWCSPPPLENSDYATGDHWSWIFSQLKLAYICRNSVQNVLIPMCII